MFYNWWPVDYFVIKGIIYIVFILQIDEIISSFREAIRLNRTYNLVSIVS
jgi:hypothetical protein